MTVVRGAARRRWIIVGAAVAVLCASPAVVAAWPVHAPDVGVQALYERIRASASRPYQGYAVVTAYAGLPVLPRLADVSSLLDGTTSLRAWYAGPDRWRVDVIDTAGERGLYQTPDGQYGWDFGANLLTELAGSTPVRLPRGADLVPPDLARGLLAAGAGDRLSARPARRVAGVDAAGLRMSAPDVPTTIASVDVWADPATGLPLQVEVTGRGAARPVLVSRFLQISADAPGAAVLTPPAVGPGTGFTVASTPDIQRAFGVLDQRPLPARLADQPAGELTLGVRGVAVYGSGWARFAVVPVPRRIGFEALNAGRKAGGSELTFPGGEGVLMATPLLSVLVVDAHPARRRYLLAGMVDGAVLARAGAELSTFTGTAP